MASTTTDTNGTRKASQLCNFIGVERSVMALELTPVAFRLAWTIIVVAHTLCMAFLISTAMAYWYFNNLLMGYFVRLWSPATGNRDYGSYAMVFALVGFVHAIRVGKLLYISIATHQLVFRRALASSAGVRKHFPALGPISDENSQEQTSFIRSMLEHLKLLMDRSKRLWNSLFSSQGVFGVENKHFLTLFVLREMVEVISQIYQAYQSSHLLPQEWLTTLLVVLLVANCWSTLAVEQFLQHKPALERVVALSADVVICIAISVIVPAAIMTPYYLQFDVANYSFKDNTKLHDPVFFSTLVLESKLVFVDSFVDFGLKLLPHVTIYMSLSTITDLMVRKSGGISPMLPSLEAPKKNVHDLVPLKRVHWLQTCTKLLFCATGALLLGLHVHAAVKARSNIVNGCRASTRPWFANGHASCSSIVIDCHQRGTKSALDSDFDKLDSVALATLSIVHCPELSMPQAIQRFGNLLLLHVYNSTVVEWERETLTAVANPLVRLLDVVRTRFPSGFPQGLVQPLPSFLLSINFCITDISAIPDTLPTFWPPMAAVAFEYGELTEIPTSLLKLRVAMISLKGNRLESIPQLANLSPEYVLYLFTISENPLQELPATLKSSQSFVGRLDLQKTNISVLPDWTQTRVLDVAYMHDTPYCTETNTRQENVRCTEIPSQEDLQYFPIELLDRLYLIK